MRDTIIIHCSATRAGQDFTAADIDRWHRQRGFRSIGYHFVVRLDGTVEPGRDVALDGAHCTGWNHRSIGICYIGGLDKNGRPADTRTEAQREALVRLVEDLRLVFPSLQQVIGHRGTAKDPVKDQTDFLAQIDYLQVSKLMFPIGGLMKQEVREIANRAGLPSAKRKDSQGICFLGKINYNDFVRRFLGEKEGAIVELETGKKVGTHRGYWFHTIGQRKGLGLSGGPWFVVKKDIEENTIYVSRGYGVETQYGNEFRMHDFHFITDNPWKGQEKEIDITFKIRHTPEFTKGKLIQEGERQFHILSSEKHCSGTVWGDL